MIRSRITLLIILIQCCLCLDLAYGQNARENYQKFKDNVHNAYSSFRDECNRKYAEFLLTAWDWYEGRIPMPLPKDDNPIPPIPYGNDKQNTPIEINPIEVIPIKETPQPKPIGPIKEQPTPEDNYFSIDFYGNTCKVRMPEIANINVADCSPQSISTGWEQLCSQEMNNTIRDCLETRIRYSFCDWAYLLFLDKLTNSFCTSQNGATLLMAFLYCQSGYQMRLAVDEGNLVMLYGSKHEIFDKGYFSLNGINFYPYGKSSNAISICNAPFEGETPMSLLIPTEQMLGGNLSVSRDIRSEHYPDLIVKSSVPENLVKFYNQYPTSALDGNPMTRWTMYANTPLAQRTKDTIYPSIKKFINGVSFEDAANMLLNWVQTGFVYEYDDKVWGHDRAFFAEETLYYPYADCEDRSILFSRLVRDILGLDVALIYYPGHLATAVCFNEDVYGDAIIINDRKFIVCDPTYIGAPVGVQMPGLEYDKTQAINASSG